MRYAFPPGGHPGQNDHPESTAIFTEAYAVIPASVQRDIVTSFLPGWDNTRAWILARPMTGFAETFAQYALELDPEGGSNDPEPDMHAQAILFVAKGTVTLNVATLRTVIGPGTFAYIPPGARWSLWNESNEVAGVHWIRKRYERGPGLAIPEVIIKHETEVDKVSMPDANGVWATQRFIDPLDLRYDCHANIVNFEPGGRIPFAETHVMEHGLYVLQGTAEYLLNKDWVTVGPGDFLWLRAFCPQACVATGDEPFRYLLYKDVNRHPSLTPVHDH